MDEEALESILFEGSPSSSSVPSQPAFPSPTSQLPPTLAIPSLSPPSSEKRRRHDEQSPTSSSSEWKIYPFAPRSYQVHDLITLASVTEYLDVTAQASGSNFSHSQKDDTWICYRQNQFKLIVLFHSSQPLESMCVPDGMGVTRQITQMCAKVYAVGEVGGVMRDELRVGLHIAGKVRRKSNKTAPELTAFNKGKLEFTNLQWDKSNAAKQNQVEYYRLVVALYARCQDTDFHIFSKISPRIIVRSQHPGVYEEPTQKTSTTTTTIESNTTSTNKTTNTNPTLASAEFPTSDFSAVNTTYSSTSRTDTLPTSPTGFGRVPNYGTMASSETRVEVQSDWIHHGKIGINTNTPQESLHVQGNILVTGNLYKPSDERIKTNIEPVDSGAQLRRLRKLKIYDYNLQSTNKNERGVLAQELQETMPEAVHSVGDTEMGSSTVPNLLVVNERSLLYENIGATQELDKELEWEKQSLISIDARVHDIAETTTEQTSLSKRYINFMLDMLYREENLKGLVSYEGIEESYVSFSLSLFRMGPARSLLTVGYFSYVFWALGSIFVFSNVKTRRVMGFGCILSYILAVYKEKEWWEILVDYVLGIALLVANYIRLRKSLKQEQAQRDAIKNTFKASFSVDAKSVIK